MTTLTNRIWYKARLLPGAQNIFTDGFYPERKKRTGNQYVYFTTVQDSPNNVKYLVASRVAENSFKMMTAELANQCLEPLSKTTKAEAICLDDLSNIFKRNL